MNGTRLIRQGAGPVLRPATLRNPGVLWPLMASCAGWIVLLSLSAEGSTVLCLAPGPGAVASAIGAAFLFARPWHLALAWSAMTAAMMGPLALVSLAALVARTTPVCKARVAAGALAGYMGVWCALGPPVVACILALRSVNEAMGWGPAGLAVLAYGPAIAWVSAPARQSILKTMHRVPLMFGDRQARQAMRHGCTLGLRCSAACLALMVAPMIAGQGGAGMVLTAHVLLVERTSPRPADLPLRLVLATLAGLSLLTG